jgi:hypothetical protein
MLVAFRLAGLSALIWTMLPVELARNAGVAGTVVGAD